MVDLQSMENIVMSLLCFFGSFAVHVVLHRLFHKNKTIKLRVLLGYVIGLLILVFGIFSRQYTGMYVMPFTSIFLYVSLSCFISIVYFPYILDGQTPSSDILQAFQKHPILFKKQIIDIFTEQNLIDVRIETLRKKKFITLQKNRYHLSWKGKIVSLIIGIYTRLLGVEVGG